MNETKKQLTINTIDPYFHDGKGGFREQMFTLRVKDVGDDDIWMWRSHFLTCQSAMAGFDVDNPGRDTAAGWAKLDDLIEKQEVRGTFHTHPAGVNDFSTKDFGSMSGLARANGQRYLWHGVQAVGSAEARFLCAHMIGGQVIFYDMGELKMDVFDPIIQVPLPPRLREIAQGVFKMDWMTE